MPVLFTSQGLLQPSCRWLIRAPECWRSLNVPVQDAQSPLGPWPHRHLQPLGMAPGDTSCRAVAPLWLSRQRSGKGRGGLALPWLFAQFCPAAWVHMEMCAGQLVNGEQRVLGFASHPSALQAAPPVSRGEGLIPRHRGHKAFHSVSHHSGRHQLSTNHAGCKGSCCQGDLQTWPEPSAGLELGCLGPAH